MCALAQVRECDTRIGVVENQAGGVGRHRRVSAVAVVTGLRLWVSGEEDVAVFHNPNAAKTWPTEWLPTTRAFGRVSATDEKFQFDWLSG